MLLNTFNAVSGWQYVNKTELNIYPIIVRLPLRSRCRQKGSMRINTSSRHGFTMVEIMIVVAIIGLLASVAIPNYVKARGLSQRNACINNLRQLDGAVQQWALENKKALTDPVTINDATPFLKNSVVCQAGGTTVDNSYSVKNAATPPECISPGGTSVNGHFLPQ
jgi:prepilin-type N-terminal cleavage/methylation domain-containing protein